MLLRGLSSLSASVCFEVPLSHASLAVPFSPSTPSPSSSEILSSPSSTPFNLTDLCFSTSTQCWRSYKLVESGLATHCPCQLKTGAGSSRHIHMSVVYTQLCTSSMIIVPSQVFRKCRFFRRAPQSFQLGQLSARKWEVSQCSHR